MTNKEEKLRSEAVPLAIIPENGCKGLSLAKNGVEMKLIALRKDGDVFCYLNQCPHTGVNLEWMPDQFLDITESLIQCATHGALFQIENGFCISGPCSGQSLTALPVELDEDKFWVIWE